MQKYFVQPYLWSLLILVESITFSGCAGISDCKYDLGQKIRTNQAWHAYDGCHDECFSCDYRQGWKAGYLDVATGGEGCPPLIAPKRYWKPPVFTHHDPSARDEWYCGYQDGAACAKTQPDFHYLKLWTPACPPVHAAGYSVSAPSLPDYAPVTSAPDATDEATSAGSVVTPPDAETTSDNDSADAAKTGDEAAPVPPGDSGDQQNGSGTPEGKPDDEADPAPAPATSSTDHRFSSEKQNAPSSYLQQLLMNSARAALSENQADQLNDGSDGGVMDAMTWANEQNEAFGDQVTWAE
jgi:hypothetical protein